VNAFAAGARARVRRVRSQARLLGPALVAAAAYVDPGNVASNTTAGAEYGYLLVWVVLGANMAAGLVQYLSAKLGIVTGRSLPELLRDRLPSRGRLLYWFQAELVAMATDVAEILGGAIALALLFGLPLLCGGIVTTLVSVAVLGTRARGGPRRFEQVITAMLCVVAVGFVTGLFFAPPDAGALAGGLVPRLSGSGSVLLATAMLGATVMPHAIYAHSALARDRHPRTAGPRRARLLAATRVDVSLALVAAGAVNLALLVLGSTALRGDTRATTIEGVHAALTQHLGVVIGLLFVIALLFSGLASTAVGCYSGSVVIEGLLDRTMPPLVRRIITAVPALVIFAAGVNSTTALILSQVVLSFGIPFALIPLVVLTSRGSVMGRDRNSRLTALGAGVVCVAIVGLNLALLVLTVTPHH
jgi:manganese transport protein